MSTLSDHRRAAAVFRARRRMRVNWAWRRFCALCVRDGLPYPRDSDSIETKVQQMRAAVAAGVPTGWRWESALEFCDLSSRDDVEIAVPLTLVEPTPTHAMAGTRAKLAELARRVECGEELWHDDDGPCVPPGRILETLHVG